MLIRYDTSASPVVHDFLFGKKSLMRHCAIQGPFRSGKSVACLMKLIYISTHIQIPNINGVRRTKWLVVRNTNRMLKDTTIATVKRWIPPGLFGIFKESQPYDYHITEIPGAKGTKAEIHLMFRALENEGDVANLLSLEITGAWINEYREIPQHIFEGIDGRVKQYPAGNEEGCTWGGIIMDTNPPEEDSYYYNYFEHNQKVKNIAHLWKQPSGLSPYAENIPHINGGREYYENLAATKEDWYVNNFVHAKYGYLRDGKPVHPNYSDTLHVANTELNIIPGMPVIMAFDFGLTPACAIMQNDSRGRILIIKEFATDDMSISQLLDELLIPYIIRNVKHNPIIVTGDPAGNQRSEIDKNTCYNEISKAFHSARIEPFWTNDDLTRRNGLDKALRQTVEGKGKILISPSCRMIREGLSSKFRFRKLNLLKREEYRTKPDKNIWSHICEAVEYGVCYIEDISIKETKPSVKYDKIPQASIYV